MCGGIFSLKKEWSFAICNNMVRPVGIMPSEISQTEKDKYSIPYMWNLKKIKQRNEYNITWIDSQI